MLQIAKILKSHGTDGGLLIGVRDIEVGQIDPQEPVFIEFDGLPVPFFIQSIQPRGTAKAVIHLNDIDSLEDAEEVVGRALFVEGEWEEEPETDFTGWTLLVRGEPAGTVTGMEPIPGNLCLYVQRHAGSDLDQSGPGESHSGRSLSHPGPGESHSGPSLSHSGLDPESLIPLHPDLILSADPERRVLDLDLPDGLL